MRVPVIEVKDLTRVFHTKVPKPGLKGKILDLWSREYRDVTAVDHISFQAEEGEFIGYIGPNGAGKSTTIKMLTGILWPTEGEVRVLGRDPHRRRAENAFQMGLVLGWHTTIPNVAYWLPVVDGFELLQKVYEIPDREFKENCKLVGEYLRLDELWRKTMNTLSQGQWVRTSTAAAFIHNPRVVYLDEPTIAMDILVKEQVREFLRKVNRERGTTMLLTTHDLRDIEELCRRVMVIDKGKIIYDGSLQSLKDRYAEHRVVKFQLEGRLSGEEPLRLDLPAGAYEVTEASGLAIQVRFDKAKLSALEVIRAVLDRHPSIDVSIEEPGIEAVVRRIYQESASRTDPSAAL